MFIPKLGPDETVTPAAFNRLVDKANSRIKSVVSSSIHASQALGTMMTPERSPEGIFAVLTARGPDKHPHHYEFREVVQDEHGDWVPRDGGYRSERLDDGESVVINPAVELNGITGIEPNTVVRLIPAPRMAADNQGRVGREWYFDSATQIRAFCLLQDLIPTGGGEPDLSVEGYFLDDPTRPPVTFYPPHPSTFEHHEVISLGIGRVAGYYTTGTKGWAQWVDRAIAEVVEDRIVWHGEWQIVTLYASLIAEVRIYEDPLLPGKTGPAQLWWMDVDDEEQVSGDANFALINSTYELRVTNTLEATLPVGTKVAVQFDRHDYRWYPMPSADTRFFGIVQTGFDNDTGAATRTVSLKTCDWQGSPASITGAAFNGQTQIRPNKDTALFDDYVVEYVVEADGTKVIVSDIWDEPHGTVVWEALDVANIRDGWALCDGAATFGPNFHGGANVPDWSGRFVMAYDPGGLAAVGAFGGEDTVGGTGGFRVHGQTENNHTTHTAAEIGNHGIAQVLACVGNHAQADVVAAIADHAKAAIVDCIADHPQMGHSLDTAGIDFAEDPENRYIPHPVIAHIVDGAAADVAHAAGAAALAHINGVGPALTHSILQHDGPFNANTDTDNRPRYYTSAARIRND